MIQIPQKQTLIPMSVRLSPETAESVRALAERLSVGELRVTEGAVMRQIITDFFSSERVRNVNEETR